MFKSERKRYIITGLLVTIFNWSLILFLVEIVHLHYLIGFNIATVAATLMSYYLSKYHVFMNYEKEHVKHGIKFIALQAFLWGLANIILFLAVDLIGIHYFVVVIFRAFFLFVLKYYLMKVVVFN